MSLSLFSSPKLSHHRSSSLSQWSLFVVSLSSLCLNLSLSMFQFSDGLFVSIPPWRPSIGGLFVVILLLLSRLRRKSRISPLNHTCDVSPSSSHSHFLLPFSYPLPRSHSSPKKKRKKKESVKLVTPSAVKSVWGRFNQFCTDSSPRWFFV